MPVLPPFQALPLHVAEAIADYYVSVRRYAYATEPAKLKLQKSNWRVLYDISYSWRILALGHFCNTITLKVSQKVSKTGFYFTMLPRDVKARKVELNSHVKKVVLDLRDVLENPGEEILSAFRVSWPESLVLPSARFLTIVLTDTLYITGTGSYDINESKMLVWVAQRIPTSIPMLQQAEICTRLGFRYETQPATRFSIGLKVDSLLSAVIAKAKRLDFSITPLHVACKGLAFLDNCPKLTSLRFNCSANIEMLHGIIERYAPILESLDIVNFPCAHLRSLFYSDKDQQITYPRLRRLEFRFNSFIRENDEISLGKDIVPFPALTYLSWPMTYTFSDDTIFRGNSGTLEYLDISIDTNLVDILDRYKVFSCGKYSKIRHITVRNSCSINVVHASFESFVSYAVGLIAPATNSFKLIDYSLRQPLTSTIPTGAFAENIQVLNLSETKLVLLDMLDLIKVLPNMTDFTCLPGGIGVDVSKKRGNHISDLETEYFPLSHRLRCWRVSHTYGVSARSIAISSIALAILCTKFTCTDVPHEKRKLYNYELRKVVKGGDYSKHMEKIEPLYMYETL